MRKYLLIPLLAILFSCQQPSSPPAADTTPPQTPPVQDLPNVRVYNSVWDVVIEATVARDLTSTADIQNTVDTYNAAHTDDQYFLVDGDPVPIEDAPPCTMFIVKPITYEILQEYHDIPRTDTRDRMDAWRFDARMVNGILYVDNVPPAPPPPAPIDPYVYYAIYVVAADGSIMYETHCEDWQTSGAGSIDAWFDIEVRAYQMETYLNPGSYLVTRQIYTPPVM